MDLTDEILIPAPRDEVYAALNDVEVLKACIPGCDELAWTSETELEAIVVLKVGPVKAKFKGEVTLNAEGAPENFSLSGKGSGGAAGFAKGGADVQLEDRGAETLLRYEAKADIGGKLAQLGNRLVASTSKKLSSQFFEKFSAEVVARQG